MGVRWARVAPTLVTVQVLVVDDDPSIRALLRDVLEEAGYQVREAADGQAALAVLAEDDQQTVVILDQSMPRLTGTEVAAVIAQDDILARRCACILLTGCTDRFSSAVDLPRVGKPFELGDLLGAVSTAERAVMDRVCGACLDGWR